MTLGAIHSAEQGRRVDIPSKASEA
jgi:hypothetical protein